MNNDESQTPKPQTSLVPKKVFDVMRPGKAPASPNSRNVIMGHKPQVKEDMFIAPSSGSRFASNPNDQRPLMNPSDKVELSPIVSDQDAPVAEPAETEAVATPEKVAMSQVVENPTSPETQEAPPEQGPTAAPEQSLIDEANRLIADDNVVAQTSAPALDHAVVSHHKQGGKWWKWLLLFVLVIIAALAVVNFLVDAEVVTIDVPHTNLIK